MKKAEKIKQSLREWVVKTNGKVQLQDITDQMSIIEQRIISSLQVMELILFIEQLSGKPVDVEDLQPGAFRNIETIYQHFFNEASVEEEETETIEEKICQKLLDFNKLDGYKWLQNGQSALSGDLLDLYRMFDNLFLQWASEFNAKEYLFPTFITASELNKLNYFHSFPQLVTFPITLDMEEENLKSFSKNKPIDEEGNINLTKPSPIRDVMTPAACYHFYIHFNGEVLEKPLYLTTKNTCFRRETHYLPLQKQWSFSLREIVCIGSMDEVKEFLAQNQEKIANFFKKIQLDIEWENATDPFFDPSQNPKYLLQKLAPVKTEMVFQNSLAIGSINFHRNYFGETFNISREGKEAFSGCVGFGIERWIYAFLTQFGSKKENWPNLL